MTTQITINDIERRLVSENRERHFAFVKNLITLSSSGLTLLIALQKSYVTESSEYIFILQICWASLAIAIASGLLVLFGESQSILDAANHLRKQRNALGDQAVAQILNSEIGFTPRRIFKHAFTLLVGSFLVSLVSLALFAILNASPY